MVFLPLPQWTVQSEEGMVLSGICSICLAWLSAFIIMGLAVWLRCYQKGDRIHWYEIHDSDHCPQFIKKMVRLYLKVGWDTYGLGSVSGSLARSVGVTLFKVLCRHGLTNQHHLNSLHLVDICAGGGGPSILVHRSIHKLISDERDNNVVFGNDNNRELKINTILTDLFPVPSQWQQLVDRNPDISLQYCSDQVDALNIDNCNILEQLNDSEKDGWNSLVIRTIYSSFHHFTPYQTVQLVSDAMYHGHGFFMVEPMLGRSSPFEMILMLLLTVVPLPIAMLAICVELLNDTRVSLIGRIMNSILAIITMPVTLSVLCHDTIISCARTYSVDQLAKLIELAKTDVQKRLDNEQGSSQVQIKDYHFEITDSEYAELKGLSVFGVGRMTVFVALPRQ